MAISKTSRISSVDPEGVLTLSADDSVAEASRRMRDHQVGSLVVTDESGRLVGMITERDLMNGAHAVSAQWEQTPVSELMTAEVVSVGPEASAEDVSRVMASHRVRHLPILDGERVVGIVSARDILARQLQVAQASKTAAEMVALLGKGLRRLDPDELVEMIRTKVPEMFQAQRWVLYLADEAGGGAGGPGIHRNECPCGDDALAMAASEADATEGVTIREDPPQACRDAGCDGCRAVIALDAAVPRPAAEGAPAPESSYLCMCGLGAPTHDAREVLRYKLELVADILGMNLLNARLYQAAYRDPLTDLCARRAVEEALLAEHARALQHHRPFSAIVLDVDGFKAVNDAHGHRAGDQLLKELGRMLRAAVRTYDLLARDGGDEFTVLMPEVGLGRARDMAERLRHSVEERLAGPGQDPVTVSVGVASWTGESEDTGPAVVRRAHAALYEAKRNGRNRVISSLVPVPEEAPPAAPPAAAAATAGE